jgi:cation:H+ antiporter
MLVRQRSETTGRRVSGSIVAVGRRWLAVDILRVIAGLVILIVAADRLVLSAVRIAKVFNISTVIIGAVIVGFGTSVPEFVVSAVAASRGNIDLALSNVVASNTTNVTLVLGVAAVIAVLATRRTTIKREGVLMIVAVVSLSGVIASGTVTRFEGYLLVAGMVAAILLLIRWARSESDGPSDELADIEADRDQVWLEVFYGIAALAATVIAGQQLLTGVVGIGAELGFSVVFMGLITGVGTSLPELSAAVAAARRGQTQLVLGNVIGSNVFNSLGVAGLAIAISPGKLADLSPALLAIMVGTAVFAGVFSITSQKISRLEGLVLLAMFLVYVLLSL